MKKFTSSALTIQIRASGRSLTWPLTAQSRGFEAPEVEHRGEAFLEADPRCPAQRAKPGVVADPDGLVERSHTVRVAADAYGFLGQLRQSRGQRFERISLPRAHVIGFPGPSLLGDHAESRNRVTDIKQISHDLEIAGAHRLALA